MRINIILAAALAASLATACASTGPSATPYQPAGKSGYGYGYKETQLETNRSRLSFSGNAETEAATVKKYVLFRAAETTLLHGYDFFTIVDRGMESEAEFKASGPVRPRLGGGKLEQSGAEYVQTIDVTMFRGARPTMAPNAYDAREIVKHLEREIERPATKA
jgi:hypothetical protein